MGGSYKLGRVCLRFCTHSWWMRLRLVVGGCVGTKTGEDTLRFRLGRGSYTGVGVGVEGCLCFGDGVGVGSMYDGTGSAHSELGVVSWSLHFGGVGVGSMCGGTGSAHSETGVASWSLIGLSRSRRKSAWLCFAGMWSVVNVLLLGSLSVVSESSLSLLNTAAAAVSHVGAAIVIVVVVVLVVFVFVVIVVKLFLLLVVVIILSGILARDEGSPAFAVSLL